MAKPEYDDGQGWRCHARSVAARQPLAPRRPHAVLMAEVEGALAYAVDAPLHPARDPHGDSLGAPPIRRTDPGAGAEILALKHRKRADDIRQDVVLPEAVRWPQPARPEGAVACRWPGPGPGGGGSPGHRRGCAAWPRPRPGCRTPDVASGPGCRWNTPKA